MTTIRYEDDADRAVLAGSSIAVVGYGNQGRSWALNLRDSGLDPVVCVRADESRARAIDDGFAAADLSAASEADVACLLVPDDVIPQLGLTRPADGLTIVASGYSVAFGGFAPDGDIAMVAPRMLGPEVRNCYVEGRGFITAIGVAEDRTANAWPRTLAIASAIGGLSEGAIEMTPRQEATLDLAVEQLLAPALVHVNGAFATVMLEQGIPIEAVMCELMLSGEIERNYRMLREEGWVAQLAHHSPTSQYGQLSRMGRYDHLDVVATMRELVEDITSGRFAAEWEADVVAGHPGLDRLRAERASPEMAEFERDLRSRLGPEVHA